MAPSSDISIKLILILLACGNGFFLLGSRGGGNVGKQQAYSKLNQSSSPPPLPFFWSLPDPVMYRVLCGISLFNS